MRKILVTTDFSANSKAALRFAIQLASQCEVSLTFLHVHNVMRMTSWDEATYRAYEKDETLKAQTALDQYVLSIYDKLKLNPTNYACRVENSPLVDSVIMGYADDHAFDFICISARGAGTFEKLVGTTTANLINRSPVPVIAVPGTYQATKLTNILYASDLSRLEPQVKQVIDFARPLGAWVELLHFINPGAPFIDPEIINMVVQKFTDYHIIVKLKPRDLEKTVAADIESVVKVEKPSLMIMFTQQNEGFFSRLFLSGNSVDYSFLTTIPMLVFSKA